MHRSHVLALVVSALVATAPFAGAQATSPSAPSAERAGRGAERHEGHDRLLRGVKLSATEKARVKEIHGKYRTETQALRQSMKPAMQEARAARQKGDTAAARAVMARTQADREKMRAVMTREQTEVRSALAPEHQKQFDANLQQFAQRRADWAKKGGKKEHSRA